MAGELCELRDRDLCFSEAESGELLANFGVQVAAADLALLHQRTEGWAAAVQMAALSLRGAQDPGRAARALGVRGYAIAEYFSDEVLEQQPAEVARFMLDTCVLGELTADACAAVSGRRDAAALLHGLDAANLFLVALDEERTSFRYHHLVHQILRTRSAGQGPGPGAGGADCGRVNGSSQRVTCGVRRAISWRRSRPTGRWPCCRTGSSPASSGTVRCRHRRI